MNIYDAGGLAFSDAMVIKTQLPPTIDVCGSLRSAYVLGSPVKRARKETLRR